MTASGGSRPPVPPPPAPDEWQALEPLLDQMLDCPPHHRAALLSRQKPGVNILQDGGHCGASMYRAAIP